MDVAEPASENQYCVLFFQDSQQDMVFLPSFKLMWPLKKKKLMCPFSWVLANGVWLDLKWPAPDNL